MNSLVWQIPLGAALYFIGAGISAWAWGRFGEQKSLLSYPKEYAVVWPIILIVSIFVMIITIPFLAISLIADWAFAIGESQKATKRITTKEEKK